MVEDVMNVAVNFQTGGVAQATVTLCPVPVDMQLEGRVRRLEEPPPHAIDEDPPGGLAGRP